ncbi:MAG: hypothetical protein KGH98_02035 [Candidatus Micrarchaeota archaeon]|nr:hypothetical protein [Candidatus Micrarchaeota archaeon]
MAEDRESIVRRLAFKLISKKIAGSTANSMLEKVRELNAQGLHSTITFINEGVDDTTKARYNLNAYAQTIRQIYRLHLNAGISIRLSQLGYSLGEDTLNKSMEGIFRSAQGTKIPIWIETESSIGTERQLRLYRRYKPLYQNLGIEIPILQVHDLVMIREHIRPNDMVKLTTHIYNANPVVERPANAAGRKPKQKRGQKNGYDDHRHDTFHLYVSYISALLVSKAKVVIQESDDRVISRIARFNRDYKRHLIFEMPLGYSERRLKRLVKQGITPNTYVPYGKDWVPYALSRLEPGRIRDIAVSVLDGQHKNDLNG